MTAPPFGKGPDTEVPIGTFVKIGSLETAEILALAGFDFVVIDTEHAPLSVRDVYELVVTFSTLGVDPLVRLSDHGYGDGQRYLDAGAKGLLVPHVGGPAEAATAMRQFMFPPEGTRGMGYASRAGGWGLRTGGPAEYLRAGREDILRIAMIEDMAAAAAIGAIASAPGVNAVFIGAADLAVSMGLPQDHPDVLATVDSVIEYCAAASVAVGVLVADAAAASARAAQGCTFLLTSSDAAMLANAAKRTVTRIKSAFADRQGA